MIAIGSASTSDPGGEVRLWDAHTGTAVGSPIRYQGAVRAIAFSPDDRILLSGGEDQNARFWDVATGKPIGLPLLHDRAVVAVAFSPDGRIAATACGDQTARFWHVPTGVPLGLPLRHEREVRTLAFSPDGATLVTGGADRMIHFWSVPKPLEGSVDEIKRSVEIACGAVLSADGGFRDLDAAPSQERVGEPASAATEGDRQSVSFAVPPETSVRWHEQQALGAIQAAKWQAAVWHLDRAIKSAPGAGDWLCHVLRTEANLRLGRDEPAAADFKQAVGIGPAEQVIGWYRSFAAQQAAEERNQAEFWYLDHLIAARPEYAVLYVQRGLSLVKQNRSNEAGADYAKAAELSPDDAQLWFATASFDFDRGEWKSAARAFDHALTLEPHDHYQWYQSSAAHLRIGDRDGYRRICREMLDRFGQTQDPAIAERVAKTCLLVPDPSLDQARVEKLVERAITGTERHYFYPFFCAVKGIAEFRGGRPAQAIDWFTVRSRTSAAGSPALRSLAGLFTSMAYHQLGRAEDARRALAQARELIEAELQISKPGNAVMAGADWLRTLAVLREAETLVNDHNK
jgi:tetratricopeptide (TPR) repeat protein